MQTTVGVVVVGALHDAVLPHDAPDAAQVVEDVEVEGRQARRSIERGVAPVDEDLIQIAVIIEDVAAVLDGVAKVGYLALTADAHQAVTADAHHTAGERYRVETRSDDDILADVVVRL
jgi:hypothetical protein